MHRFMRAVGFAGLKTRRDEDWLINKISKEFSSCTSFTGKNGEEQVALDAILGQGIGITLRGSWREDGTFRPEYYYPFVRSKDISSKNPVQVEKHAEHAQFSGSLEDSKLGFMLIFFVQNAIQCEKRSGQAEMAMQRGGVKLSALSVGGMVLLPLYRSEEQVEMARVCAEAKLQLIEQAKQGDEEAMQTLSMNECDELAGLVERIATEDVYSIVDTSFIPCGVESDHYTILGDILEARVVKNRWSGEKVHLLKVACNEVTMDVAINDADLMGIPEAGRRFRGDIWLQGQLEMPGACEFDHMFDSPQGN